MQRAIIHVRAGDWPKDEAADSVTLDFDARHRRRIRLACDGGKTVLLDLPVAVAMTDGDGLRLQNGRWIAVRAASEELVEITCEEPELLIRIAWHLGNRHLPTQLAGDVLLIRPDHVIEDMVVGLGASVRHVQAPFQPEGGAYGNHAQGYTHGSEDRSRKSSRVHGH